jgi:hypothetical protein
MIMEESGDLERLKLEVSVLASTILAERKAHLDELRTVGRSFTLLKHQVSQLWILLFVQYYRNRELEKSLCELISSHPMIMLLNALKR